MKRPVFVFGSNLAGRHGKGAALWARRNRGAVYGQPDGLQGDSYGIPTKDANIQTLPLEEIERHVRTFLRFAVDHPDLLFEVTAIGCGYAGYKPEQIAPFFEATPDNVFLQVVFHRALGRDA